MFDDAPRITCPSCHQSFPERRLTARTVESCPHCRAEVRSTSGFSITNAEASIAGNIAAIDAWLDNHKQATGMGYEKKDSPDGYTWQLATDLPWTCQITYSRNDTGYLTFRLASTDKADTIFSHQPKWATICASHGLQPCGMRTATTHASGAHAASSSWGVFQVLSTNTLPEGLFPVILGRLDAAMRQIQGDLSDNLN